MSVKKLQLVGLASGLAGVDKQVGNAPIVIRESPYFADLIKKGVPIAWREIIELPQDKNLSLNQLLLKVYQQLALKVAALIKQGERVSVIGGDHACAIGTWHGVYEACHQRGDMGLIWIDAHMDSHTPETSESQRIHGMPLATLLGHGDQQFTQLLKHAPILKPEHVCLIGVRSYEAGEADLLKRLNVRIYFMEEVNQRGFMTVFQEAVHHVKNGTIGYGVSLDLDSIDPKEAPGVDVPEPNGIAAKAIEEGLRWVASDPQLLATEIVEFDPSRDQDHLTERLLIKLLAAIA